MLHEGQPVGVLILSRMPASESLELTYIGLARVARGKGIASQLLRLAICRAAELSCQRLTTAVDAHNTPAMTMYVRAGMMRVGKRQALLRVIHSGARDSSTISPQELK
jgi:RimJ/RimL family protein N-acetyltransferase